MGTGNDALRAFAAPLGDRILVLGCPGAGKTTLARAMADTTGLPCVHLDDEYFGPGWTPKPDRDWRDLQRELVSRPRWIIDGNHAGTLADRLPAATGVVVVDEAPARCLLRYTRRTLGLVIAPAERIPGYMWDPVTARRRVADRPVAFARFILRFRRATLPAMLRTLEETFHGPVVVVGRGARPVPR